MTTRKSKLTSQTSSNYLCTNDQLGNWNAEKGIQAIKTHAAKTVPDVTLATTQLQLEAGRLDENIEIAALISESLETLQRTHSRYFTGQELPAS